MFLDNNHLFLSDSSWLYPIRFAKYDNFKINNTDYYFFDFL